MRKFLNILICVLLTSHLTAFDSYLDGFVQEEPGFLQVVLDADEFAGGSEVVSKTLVLGEGDIMKVLQLSLGKSNFNDAYVRTAYPLMYVISNGIETSRNKAGYIVGPASVRVGYKFSDAKDKWKPKFKASSYFIRADYLIFRAR